MGSARSVPDRATLTKGQAGQESDFTNRNTTFMAWNLMHLAKLLRQSGGIPAWGNVPEQWNAGKDLGLDPNPEYR